MGTAAVACWTDTILNFPREPSSHRQQDDIPPTLDQRSWGPGSPQPHMVTDVISLEECQVTEVCLRGKVVPLARSPGFRGALPLTLTVGNLVKLCFSVSSSVG